MDLLQLNMGTMLVVLILGHFSTGILVVSYVKKHNRSKAVQMFLLSKLIQPAAWFLFGLRAFAPSMTWKIVAHAIVSGRGP